MSFVSYSQNFEDVMLWRALKDVQEGFYIDVGAHDPTHGSVTKAFYEQGWSGINIEPIEGPFELLKGARPRDINLQICAGARNGEIDIYGVLPSGLATTQPSIAEEYRTAGHSVTRKQVPVQTLQEICKEYVTGEIHFLKIDVEGFEKEVLQGADFTTWRPWIVVIEATYPNSPKENFTSWEYLILDAGYKFTYFDGLNRFYVAIEHEKLLPHFNTPPNYFDGFALSSSCFFSRRVTAELHQVEADAQQANERAQQAEAALLAISQSRSWRLTRPLRQLGSHLRKIKNCIRWFKTLIKKFIRSCLQGSMTFLHSRPSLRLKLINLSTRLGLYSNLRTIYRSFSSSSIKPSVKQENNTSKELLNYLNPGSRRIYCELKAAVVQRQKERS